MTTRGLLIRLESAHGKDAEVEEFLRSSGALLKGAATAWFGLRFGRSEYGIFTAFANDSGRDSYLAGPIAEKVSDRVGTLFAGPPQLIRLDILASKLPQAAVEQPDTKGLLLTFSAKSGNEDEVEQFLRNARGLVEQEPDTTAWFAIHLDDGAYGIFDVFPDHAGRFKHLTGRVATGLATHALSLLGSLPDPELPNVIAEKLF
jgi:hypothetical protein